MSSGSCAKAARIRRLHDQLRCKSIGGRIDHERQSSPRHRWHHGSAKRYIPFDDFNDDNDPWGDHDCAILTLNRLTWHSPDASNPAVARRIMAVMVA